MELKKTEKLRLLFIEANLLINGEIGRPLLMSRFSMSGKTATRSLSFYEEYCPGQMFIDRSPVRPIYSKTKTCKPCLFKSLDEATRYMEAVDFIDQLAERNNK